MKSSSPVWKTMAALFVASLLVVMLVLATGRIQLGLDELVGPKLDAGFITTRPELVNGMMRLAEVNKDDLVYDLGCGDGRIVIAAARDHGARGVGIDLNPKRIDEANANAKAAGVENRVTFKLGDIFKEDYSDATVVALYLPADLNIRLRPQLWQQLRVGARVVSNDSDMGPEWPAEKMEVINNRTIYSWTIREEQKKAAAMAEQKKAAK